MALQKPIRQMNGIATNYHRIFYIENITNQSTAVIVASYIDKANSEEDKTSEESVWHACTTYYMDSYHDGITAEEAYEWLKTLEEFKDAVDVLEGDESNV